MWVDQRGCVQMMRRKQTSECCSVCCYCRWNLYCVWWICVWLSEKITINRMEQISNCFGSRFTADMPVAYCSLHSLLAMPHTPQSQIVIRSTPGYTQGRAEKTVMYNSLHCWGTVRAQSLFDHCWARNYLVCISSIHIRPPRGEILYWGSSTFLKPEQMADYGHARKLA